MDEGVKTCLGNMMLNADRENELANQGYSIFPFLNQEHISRLTEYYFSSQKETPDFFYSSTHSKDLAFRKNTSEFIKEVIKDLLPSALRNYRLLGGAFVVKPPNGKGLLPPHQDWNIVDEAKTRSYNLWIPIIDVTVENGAVFVLKGSHSKMQTYRGPGIDSIFKHIEKEVWEALEPLPMKAGHALLYDHALLHGSPANQTDKIRLGIVCGIIPEEAEMQLYFGDQQQVTAYRTDENFFLEKDPLKGPDGLQLLGKVDVEVMPLTKEKFSTVFLDRKTPVSQSWFSKLFKSNCK
jgi:hypothetical protein